VVVQDNRFLFQKMVIALIMSASTDKNTLKYFGKHLKKVRLEKGISGAELARMCYMDKPNLRRIERGDSNTKLLTLIKICEALEINLEDFFKEFQK
jgi:DNA-binding Xre family transcriptional regulator